jgi:acyl-homoserine lactone acylase PvdQ
VFAAALVTSGPAVAAVPTPAPYGANDGGGFMNILPSGQNGLDNGLQLLQFEANGARPPHNNDQLGMYGNLVYAVPGLRSQDLSKYYKDATFGAKPGDIARTYSPSPNNDVTIVRDKGFGVPHIYGSTRQGAMFGMGYVAAEDRLFFIDVLRHVGRAQLSAFAGGSQGNRDMDYSEWAIAPYSEADLQRQIDQLPKLYGQAGQQVVDDANNYVAGINKYIAEAQLDPTKMPGEYPAIGQPSGPTPWNTRDIIATAALVGGIFGKGGGNELASAQVFQALQKRLGQKKGRASWKDFRSANDPEAPTTVDRKNFPYEVPPKKPAKGSLAMPDPGTLKYQPVQGTGSSGSASAAGTAAAPVNPCRRDALVCLPKKLSNALVVSGRESQSGHPLAVFGPQTGYFAPQILMEEDVHAPANGGPGIDARGASFPGVNQYVELGRGRDYAWSATSAGNDIVDTFALPLCNADGSAPTLQSDHYMYRGTCRQMEDRVRSNSWTPNAADQTPPGSETLHAQITALGIVIARATIKGKPVVYTSLRSTYMHEVDSALGFIAFNDPAQMASPQGFQHAASKISYTFNWLYVDDKHDAYFNSGGNPVRGKGTDPNFPVWGTPKFEWRNWNPDNLTETQTPFSQHPQTIDQRFLTSWNNKQAHGYRSSDATWSYGSVYRSQLLSDRIQRLIAGSKKTNLTDLISAMEQGGTADLRGDKDLPWALKILGKQKDPALAGAIAQLRAWSAGGSHRRDLNHDGVYDQSNAVRIMDAWFPLWVSAEFQPTIGSDIFKQINSINEVDNAPNNHGDHLGSAYDDGWYGYINKDLRQVLHKPVKGRYSRTYCGKGSRKRCRALLASTLAQAIKIPATQVYHGDPACNDGDQWCYDAVRQRPLGAVTQPLIEWINRPTFQQAVEIQHRAR